MAFLFGKKKSQQQQQQGANPKDVPASSIPGPGKSLPTANGTPAGAKDREKDSGHESPTPSSSRNDSLSSLQDGTPPSPEQGNLREKSDLDFQAPRSAPTAPGAPAVTNPNASLYPWTQRRFTFTTQHPSPFPRYGAAVNSVANKDGDIYIMGGLIHGSTVKGDLWLVEAGGGNLSCLPLATTSEGPGPRVGHSSLIVGNAFIVYGGDTKMDERDVLDDTLYLLNTSTRHWSRAIPAGPRPSGRYGHSLNIIGSKIYIFGGQVEGYFFNDLVAFDLNALQKATNKWEMLVLNSNDGGPPPGKIPPARTNHSIVTWENQLYLFGGTNGLQWFNDVWTYDPASNEWAQLDCIGYIPAPREGHAATLVGDVMYIFGGRTEDANDLGDLAAFRISSRRWYTFQNMGPSPSPRSGHSMTSYGKQIIVLGGEPSSAPRDAAELSLVYVLDTAKIRYPQTDQASAPSTGVTDRAAANRRPTGGEKSNATQSRPAIREGLGDSRDPKRIMGAEADSIGATGPYSKNERDRELALQNGAPPTGLSGSAPGSRLPRVSMAQGPPGPPPQQEAPTPRPNGVLPTPPGSRTRTPTRGERSLVPALETSVRGPSQEIESKSPPRESPFTGEAPVGTGRRTLTGPQSRIVMRAREAGEPPMANRDRSRSRGTQPAGSIDSTEDSLQSQIATNGPIVSEVTPSADKEGITEIALAPSSRPSDPKLVQELEAVRNENAWYASELALARKSGYTPNTTNGPALDETAADSVGDRERPLLEALLTMKAELARVQGAVDEHAFAVARQIAEVERQRDVAVSEAVYAKAKLAAHGGNQTSIPKTDAPSSRAVAGLDTDRATDLNRKLAATLAAQTELRTRLRALEAESHAEKQARQLAEETARTAQNRVSELESHNQRNSSEVESLRAHLHGAQKIVREETARSTQAIARAKLLQVDQEELQRKMNDAIGMSNDHSSTLGSLREALAASTETATTFERKIEEERRGRELLERKLRTLRAEHEERTAELDTTTRRLKDAEEIGERHAVEARTHLQTVLSGLGNIQNRDLTTVDSKTMDERITILQEQVESASALVKSSQQAADLASEKLRSAEERIAGLEAYQEQASREGLNIRTQLQVARSKAQALLAENNEVKQQLASHQLEANAITVQHGALKDLLGERGVNASEHRSRGSPASGFGTPDPARVRDLEQQLEVSQKARRQTEISFEQREQEAGKMYREKLEQLENDYQSAVVYVKGTEKMLKRLKDELAKYKVQNARLQTELDEVERGAASRSLDVAASAGWEQERQSLRAEVKTLEERVKTSVGQLEKQMSEIRLDLSVAREQRDLYQSNTEKIQQQLQHATEQAQIDLDQLQKENALLESRALDAERKVSLLLDQVESSVDSYRRQSRQLPTDPNGGPSPHHSNHKRVESDVTESAYAPSNRNSVALDSLASELDALRSHWETNKSYRLSNTFDFEKTSVPSSAATVDGDVPGWSRSWREKLDQEERNGQHEGIVHAFSPQPLQPPSQQYPPSLSSKVPVLAGESGESTPTRGAHEDIGRSHQQQSQSSRIGPQDKAEHGNVI